MEVSVINSVPVFASQNLIVSSALPDAILLPSGLKVTLATGPECPLSVNISAGSRTQPGYTRRLSAKVRKAQRLHHRRPSSTGRRCSNATAVRGIPQRAAFPRSMRLRRGSLLPGTTQASFIGDCPRTFKPTPVNSQQQPATASLPHDTAPDSPHRAAGESTVVELSAVRPVAGLRQNQQTTRKSSSGV